MRIKCIASNKRFRIRISLIWILFAGFLFAQTAETQFEDGMTAYRAGDFSTALQLFAQAAEEGHAHAKFEIGMMYMKGHGVEKNAEEGRRWIEESAKAGDSLGMYNLGVLYYEGLGGLKLDYETAKYWYEKAAENKNPQAMFNLATMYMTGTGVERSSEMAFHWCKLAAEEDFPGAMLNLGMMYYYGNGTEINKNDAKYWLEKAADKGVENAKSALKELSWE